MLLKPNNLFFSELSRIWLLALVQIILKLFKKWIYKQKQNEVVWITEDFEAMYHTVGILLWLRSLFVENTASIFFVNIRCLQTELLLSSSWCLILRSVLWMQEGWCSVFTTVGLKQKIVKTCWQWSVQVNYIVHLYRKLIVCAVHCTRNLNVFVQICFTQWILNEYVIAIQCLDPNWSGALHIYVLFYKNSCYKNTSLTFTRSLRTN